MSKSEDSPGNVGSIDPLDTLARKVRTAVTDSGHEIVTREDKPAITNLLTIMSTVAERTIEELEQMYEGKGYAELKADLADALIEYLRPFQERYVRLIEDGEALAKILRVGADRARELAAPMLTDVYARVGFVPSRI